MSVDTAASDRFDAAPLARLLATCIDEPLAYVDGRRGHDAGPDLRLATDLNDVVADIIFHELVHLLTEEPELQDAAVVACRRPAHQPAAEERVAAAAAHQEMVDRLHRALDRREELAHALTSVLTTATERRREPAAGTDGGEDPLPAWDPARRPEQGNGSSAARHGSRVPAPPGNGAADPQDDASSDHQGDPADASVPTSTPPAGGERDPSPSDPTARLGAGMPRLRPALRTARRTLLVPVRALRRNLRALRRPVRAVGRAVPTLGRPIATAVLVGVVGVVIVVGASYRDQGLGALSVGHLFAVAVLSFLPAWLYVRFLRYRAGALWSEYVIHLHRLQFDAPRHLPRPPLNSVYFTRWWVDGGWVLEHAPSIYQQKFDAYYGRKVSRAGTSGDSRVAAETLFPVALASAVMATGWVLLLGDGRVLTTEEPTRLLDLLGYGFLGAYLYSLQMLMRRFFQSDLKTSAYLATVVRIITVLVVISVAWWLPEPGLRGSSGAVIAFVIGFFPLVGLQALHRAASVVLRTTVPTLRADYPLSDLDGLNIWYESRLLEEGIEDMQNLATTNLVDVMLHTRVPLGRLVDWVDQAHLYLHLPRVSRAGERVRYRKAVRAVLRSDEVTDAGDASGVTFDEAVRRRLATSPIHLRDLLRACGMRTATDVVRVLGPLVDVGHVEGAEGDPDVASRTEDWIVRSHPPAEGGLRALVVVLALDPLLTPIRAWRHWEASSPAHLTASGAGSAP